MKQSIAKKMSFLDRSLTLWIFARLWVPVLIGLVHVALWLRRKFSPHAIISEAKADGIEALTDRDRAFFESEACRALQQTHAATIRSVAPSGR